MHFYPLLFFKGQILEQKSPIRSYTIKKYTIQSKFELLYLGSTIDRIESMRNDSFSPFPVDRRWANVGQRGGARAGRLFDSCGLPQNWELTNLDEPADTRRVAQSHPWHRLNPRGAADTRAHTPRGWGHDPWTFVRGWLEKLTGNLFERACQTSFRRFSNCLLNSFRATMR